MHTPSVELNTIEQRIVRFVVKERHASNLRLGRTDHRVGPQSADQMELDGYAAEFAFCKMFNCYPDFVIGTLPAADCWRFGQAIDVKSTRYPNGHLLILERKRLFAADVYALMIVDWPMCQFAGFATAAELFTEEHRTDRGKGPSYIMEQSEMKGRQR